MKRLESRIIENIIKDFDELKSLNPITLSQINLYADVYPKQAQHYFNSLHINCRLTEKYGHNNLEILKFVCNYESRTKNILYKN